MGIAAIYGNNNMTSSLGPMAVYNVSEDVDYYADLTTMVQRETAEAATVVPASPGRLLSVDYPFAPSRLSTSATVATTTTTTAATFDYAVRNVSVALCHPSNGIPSVDEYFTGKSVFFFLLHRIQNKTK